jgi:hypothetical protein
MLVGGLDDYMKHFKILRKALPTHKNWCSNGNIIISGEKLS